MHIAIVEDDCDQAELLMHWLQLAGHHCACFASGEAMTSANRPETWDAVMLDWGLPGMNGIDLLKHIRTRWKPALPVLFVTGRYLENDLVHALQQGADDYLVKPIRRGELVARLEAITRRSKQPGANASVLALDEFQVDLEGRTIYRHGDALAVTSMEFGLVVLFFQNLGRLLSRDFIFEKVWGWERTISSRVLDTYVSRIRRSLALIPSNGWRLEAVYGQGYRLNKVSSAGETFSQGVASIA